MTSKISIEDYINRIEMISTHEEQIVGMIRGLTELFPVYNVYFFRYSLIHFISDGVFYMNEDGHVKLLNHIRDDLRTLPQILTAIQNREASLVTNESYITHCPNFPDDQFVSSMIIIPICLSANVVGYAVSTKFDEHYFKNQQKLSLLTYYGKRLGKFLEKNYNYYPIKMLTKREIEAMQLLAYGYTVKEIAETMNISEHTVKDYIQSAIKKTKAANRLHAVVILMRKGLIS